MTPPPTNIDGTDITGATIDGQEVQEITIDGETVFVSTEFPVAYTNLVAWYPFDSPEYGGNNADDVTAKLGGSGDDTAYDGTLDGGSFLSSGGTTDINAGANSGAYDSAADNNNDRIILPSSAAVLGPGSISMNYKIADNPPSSLLFTAFNFPQGFSSLLTNSNGFDINYKRKGGGTANDIGFNDASAFDGNFHNVTITHTANQEIQIFFDGVKRDSNGPTDDRSAGGEVSIFRDGDNSPEATVDDFRIYDKVLTSSEISNIVTNTIP
jgi:hypothetical protein